jgi:hypothetical protein
MVHKAQTKTFLFERTVPTVLARFPSRCSSPRSLHHPGQETVAAKMQASRSSIRARVPVERIRSRELVASGNAPALERAKQEEEESKSQTSTPKRATMHQKALAGSVCFKQGQVVWAYRTSVNGMSEGPWPAIVTSPAASPSKKVGGNTPSARSMFVRWLGENKAAESVNVATDKVQVFDSADANARRSRAAAYKAAVEEATRALAAQGVSGGTKRKSTQSDANGKDEALEEVAMEVEDVKEGKKTAKRARREKKSAPAASAAAAEQEEDTPQQIKAEVKADEVDAEEKEEEEISDYEKLRQANMVRF